MPGPYTVTVYDDRGQPARSETFLDACQALNFLDAQAALLPRERRGVRDETVEGIEVLRETCAREGTPTIPALPADAPAAPDPSATGTDTSPPGEEETAETVGAPAPETSSEVTSVPAAPGESDGRPLPEQYYDPHNPMPDYDVVSVLSAEGVPLDLLDSAFDNVIHNEPLPGLPHPYFGRDDRETPLTAVDPVDIYTGQYSLTVTDVEIPSRGFPLQLSRMYHSGPVYFGPWGYNWDHNYNMYLRELSDGGVAIWTGGLTEHVFQLNPDESFEPPVGVFNKLERQGATPLTPDRHVLTDRDGMQHIFERLDGWPYPDRIPLVRIEDRHGNAHELSYDAEGRLDRVEDHAGRFIKFEYGDCGLLEQVSDHTARVWHYFHDAEIEHLVAVITPATPEYPEGLTTCYEYDRFRRHPALLHNLIRVIDPAGQVVVENRYGDDPGTDDFGRVVYQEFGGFEATFHATPLQYVPRTPDAINIPALRVEVIDPGVLHVYTFNYRGDLLDERFRLVLDGSYRLVARIYRYDEQGNLIERREPNGLGMLYTSDHNNTDPRARGNLLKAELVAPPATPVPSRIVQLLTYEPQFHRLKTTRDEGGNVTIWVYDYEEGVASQGDVIRIEYPPATLPDGTAQPRVERLIYNTFGQIAEHVTGAGHRHVFAYNPTGAAEGYLNSITWDADGAAQIQNFEYDAFGYRSAFINRLGSRTETTYNALGQIILIRLPAVAGVVDEIRFFHTPDGRVRREERPRGMYDDGVITDPFIVNEYSYDVFGNLSAATYGLNTATPIAYRYRRDPEGNVLAVEDPLDRRTLLTYDERGLLLTQTEAPGTPMEAVWRHIYDRNGNRTAVIDPVGHQIDHQYDPWDRLRRTTLPGDPDAERTRIEFTLNQFDKVERLHITGRTAPGVVGTLLDTSTDYDERGRPWRRRLDARSTVLTYDADERVVAQTDQRDNNLTFVYDGLNRIVQASDPLGNVETRHYNGAGNLTIIESQEVLPDGVGTKVIDTSITYDSRNRPIQITAPFGRVSQISYDGRDLAVRETDPLGRVVQRAFGLSGELLAVTSSESPVLPATHRFTYDLAGRQTAYTDPEGRTTTYTYDQRNRRTTVVYPDGRTHRFFYDIHRQPVREETPGGTVKTNTYGPDGGLTRIDFAPGPSVAATPPLTMVRDGLRRVVRMQQGGDPLDRTYDSSLRVLSETFAGHTVELAYDDVVGTARLTYPDGRVDRLAFDALGRLSSVIIETVGAAGLTGPLVAGTELARYVYQGPERVARRELHNGLVTHFDYDDARRLTAILHLDAAGSRLAVMRYVYDAADRRRILWSEPLPQRPTRFDYDGLSRLRLAAFDLALSEPTNIPTQAAADATIAAADAMVSAHSERYDLNRSDARTAVTLDDGAVTTSEVYTLGAAYQITQLDRLGVSPGNWSFTFDGDGRCIQDDRYQYTYDAMGRLIEVRSPAGPATILAQVFDPAGRVVRRTEGGNTYEQVHHGFRVVQRNDTGGAPVAQFTYGLGIDELLIESTGNNRYPLLDAASSLLGYTDAAGVVLERYYYTPFGQATIWAPDGVTARVASTIAGIPRFGGHPLLTIGLYDARARIYDPHSARFLQPDPLGYLDSSSLYTYVHHDPIGFVDPTGEVGILVGLLVAAGVGLVIGAGVNAVRQGIQIHEGTRKEFSWGEFGLSAGVGAIMGPVMVFAPELGIPLAAYGVGGGVGEILEGHWETGTFDIATSLIPFGFKSVRSATFGRGSVFSPSRGLGPSATSAERFGRFPELGRATTDMVGRFWSERFYHGDTYYAASEAYHENAVNMTRVNNLQTSAPSPPELGPGLYFNRVPGEPNIPGSASWWAETPVLHGGGGRAGGPAVLEASIPRWRLFLLRRHPRVAIDVPQSGFDHPASLQSYFPFEGPANLPPTGPGARFNAWARWRIWDPNIREPSFSGLWPVLSVPSVRGPFGDGDKK